MDRTLDRQSEGVWSWMTQDMAAILGRRTQTMDPSQVHVVTVPPSGSGRELLWTRWCAALGIDGSAIDLDVALPNESLGVEQAALLHRAQAKRSGSLRTKGETHRWFRAYFAEEILASQPGGRLAL